MKYCSDKIEVGVYNPQMCNLYKRKSVNLLNFMLNFLFVVFVIFTLVNSMFSYIYVMSPISGPSMQPTLNPTGQNNEDTAYINKFCKDVTYGDIIVIYHDKYNVIKRVIALPGDEIDIRKDTSWQPEYDTYGNVKNLSLEYRIWIKHSGDTEGAFLDESSYLDYSLSEYTNLEDHYNDFKTYKQNNPSRVNADGSITIKENEIFVLGDHRTNSLDSSYYGPYDSTKMLGKVEIVVRYDTNFVAHYNQKIIGMFKALFYDITGQSYKVA